MLAYLKLFRIVNLPTVPGDVLVGASVVVAASSASCATGLECPLGAATLFSLSLASVLMYMFGLAQNDILGAKTDVGRPIPEGRISLTAAKTACACCWLLSGIVSLYPHGRMPLYAFAYLIVMTALISAYNVSRRPLLMGLCRGVNLLLGAAAAWSAFGADRFSIGIATGVALLWTVYIAAVTKYSEGEESNPAKKRCVGFLIGALVYLQLLALVLAYLSAPNALTCGTLLAGAALLILLRLLKSLLPEVSAS